MTPASIERIAIIGAGNGGLAAAVDLSLRGFTVRLYGRNKETLLPLQRKGGIEYAGVLGEGCVQISLFTSDPAEAMQGAEIVVLMVPTHAHESSAMIIAQHLQPDQVLLCAPGHTLLLVPYILRKNGIEDPTTCEVGTLPYICRREGATRIRITQRARFMPFAVFPSRRTESIHSRMAAVFPMIESFGNILDTVFAYTNAIHHPPAMVCNVGRVEATAGDFCHYYDGITPSVGRLIDALDKERLSVAETLGATALPFVEQFHRMGYTTEAAYDSGSAYEAFHQSEPDRWIRAPASLDHRFFEEDVPFGLVMLAELGRLAGIATPTMDHLIHLTAVATGRDYRRKGLTLRRMGLEGVSVEGLIRLLKNGFTG